MKINNNINRQQNFKALKMPNIGNVIEKHPGAITALAGSSVIAQKLVMSGSEATIGPVMDIAIGKAITKATGEKDGRTNDSSEKQAIRTFSQSVGGTITGIAIRAVCIGAATYACSKVGGTIASTIADKNNSYLKAQNAQKWGKSIGGALAVGVMMFTNFLIDAPFINQINKLTTSVVNKIKSKNQPQDKEVK